ncbi:MAG: hypothetical protein IPL28_09040 [Chloroflexi bacterium]|nr:hypothetical protein [Chloroflexota bacterium]
MSSRIANRTWPIFDGGARQAHLGRLPVNLATAEATNWAKAIRLLPRRATADHGRVLVGDAYGAGDQVMYIQTVGDRNATCSMACPSNNANRAGHRPTALGRPICRGRRKRPALPPAPFLADNATAWPISA